MNLRGRISDMYCSLTAKERVKLALRAMRTGEELPRQVLLDATLETRAEVKRLVRLLKEANGPRARAVMEPVAIFLTLTPLLVQAELKISLLESCAMLMVPCVATCRMPITESEYRRLQEDLCRIDYLGELEADEYEDWAPEDMGDKGFPTDEAYFRVAAQKAQELRELAAQGVLDAVETEDGPRIRRETWARLRGFSLLKHQEVWPDKAADDLPMINQARRMAWAGQQYVPPEGKGNYAENVKAFMIENMKCAWEYLEGLRTYWKELGEKELDGEDVVFPRVREKFEEMAEFVGGYAAHFDRSRQPEVARSIDALTAKGRSAVRQMAGNIESMRGGLEEIADEPGVDEDQLASLRQEGQQLSGRFQDYLARYDSAEDEATTGSAGSDEEGEIQRFVEALAEAAELAELACALPGPFPPERAVPNASDLEFPGDNAAS